MGAILLRAALAWVLIAGAETVHGILRGLLLRPVVGDLLSRQIGVFTGSVIILGIAWLSVRWVGARSRGQSLAVGATWFVLMASFEVGLGRALGASWQRIAADYDPSQGGLMLVGMAVIFFAPLLAARWRAARMDRVTGVSRSAVTPGA